MRKIFLYLVGGTLIIITTAFFITNSQTPSVETMTISSLSSHESTPAATSSKEKNYNTSSHESQLLQKTINYNGTEVVVVIDKPKIQDVDVLILYHGTVFEDSKIIPAAQQMIEKVKQITKRDDFLMVSVAYPEEGLLMGDNMKESEAALLWVQNKASEELHVNIKKIFLIGHSQGGYIVTRLNTMYETNGVIANGPGPLDLNFRCHLEESGRTSKAGDVCELLFKKYGDTQQNPEAYRERSLLSFTTEYKSKVLFIQGGQDSSIQLRSWKLFKEKLNTCKNCKNPLIFETPDFGHGALFDSPNAIEAYNNFLQQKS